MRGDYGAEAPRAGAHGQRRGGYDPNQPRVPAGNSDGGQWTDDDRWAGRRWPTDRRDRLEMPCSSSRRAHRRLIHAGGGDGSRKADRSSASRTGVDGTCLAVTTRTSVSMARTTMDGEAFIRYELSTTAIGIRRIDQFEARALRRHYHAEISSNSGGETADIFRWMRFIHAETNAFIASRTKEWQVTRRKKTGCVPGQRHVFQVVKTFWAQGWLGA